MVKRTNLQYEVEYDYIRSECTCNAYEDGDYCRCTTIERAWVESVNVSQVVEKFYKRYCSEQSEINKYCFDRICTAFKIYDKDHYEVESCGGYYGEEIEGVYFDNENGLLEAFSDLLTLESDIEKIKYVLEIEYGYLLERIKNKTVAKIKMVDTDSIVLPQQEYFVKLDREVIEDYKNRDLPIAVCLKEKELVSEFFDRYNYRYILVDGYHRFVANKDKKMMTIVVLE